MTINTETANGQESSEYWQGQAIDKHKENKLSDALTLYLKSIELNERQPEWIYGNAISLSAQINRFDIGDRLINKAIRVYPHNDEIMRGIGLLNEKQKRFKETIYFYQKAIAIDPSQPEWVYLKLYSLFSSQGFIEKAKLVKQQGMSYYPKSTAFQTKVDRTNDRQNVVVKNNSNPSQNIFNTRETPSIVEQNVDLNIKQTRRQLMDKSIIDRYEVLLEQVLYNGDRDLNKIDSNALLHCLAEIKTDLHYLKTKVLESPTKLVDPQAIEKVNIEKIVNSIKPIPIKCELKNRIVGSGWQAATENGRWTGDSTISSVVFPYPTEGKYRLEIVVKEEAKLDLLKTLTINICDRPIAITTNLNNYTFPIVITEEIEIAEQNQSFLNLDLIIAETIKDINSNSQAIGLLIQQIALIPISN